MIVPLCVCVVFVLVHCRLLVSDQNEILVGEAIQRSIRDGIVKRSDIIVESKLWNTFHKPKDVLSALQVRSISIFDASFGSRH